MREIKFRAWDGDDIVQPDEAGEIYTFNYNSGDLDVGVSLSDINTVLNAKDLTFMQYTGLKDKNGVEIYEGDICRIWAFPHFGTKERVPTKKNKLIEWHKDRPAFNFHSGEGLEVIGNIYENPRLLK